MARKKKTRRITDVMPIRKADKKTEMPKRSGKKLTRYELDAKAREDKKKRKHKGLDSGSRHSMVENRSTKPLQAIKDPKIGSKKKIPLVVEFVNKPEKGQIIPVLGAVKKQDPMQELESLENNEILNELLDILEEGKTISKADQQFVDECLDRIAELMEELGIEDEEENEADLYRTFEKINIEQFR
ncbi:Der GTPase-activating protein YihI [Rodentibacter caecimuris]|uniref:Der GTPase-activating protein YihI n=1 Tax=Rodentibacter caecimuris TaxID=1796644 RepID=UPI0013A0A8F8|nr:Der GTPase-activating protein YihI [Rodentibacter heylii]MCX2960942.1 Der GTPase-activating protein YihI [Rodentibacter heylii]QIA77028.1 Der GTPase-activating protein YihI [Rodentibacter heylii]